MKALFKNKQILKTSIIVSLVVLGIANFIKIGLDVAKTQEKKTKELNDAIFYTTQEKKLTALLATDNCIITASKTDGIRCFENQTFTQRFHLDATHKDIMGPDLVTDKNYIYILGQHPSKQALNQVPLSKIADQTGELIHQQLLPYTSESKTLNYDDRTGLLTVHYKPSNLMYILDSETLEIIDSLDLNKSAEIPINKRSGMNWENSLNLGSLIYNPFQKVQLEPSYLKYPFVLTDEYFIQFFFYSEPNLKHTLNTRGALLNLDTMLLSEPRVILESDAEYFWDAKIGANKLVIDVSNKADDHYIGILDMPYLTNSTWDTYYSWEFDSWQINSNDEFIIEGYMRGKEHYRFYIQWPDKNSTRINLGGYDLVQNYQFTDKVLLIQTQNQVANTWSYIAVNLDYLRKQTQEAIDLTTAKQH